MEGGKGGRGEGVGEVYKQFCVFKFSVTLSTTRAFCCVLTDHITLLRQWILMCRNYNLKNKKIMKYFVISNCN